MNDTPNSDFEARLASIQPESPRLSWQQLQSQLEKEPGSHSAVTALGRPSTGALTLSWLGGMALGAGLMFVLFNIWEFPSQRGPSIAQMTSAPASPSSTNSSVKAESQLKDEPPSAASVEFRDESQSSVPAVAATPFAAATYGNTLNQQQWIDALSLNSVNSVRAQPTLRAGHHFVSTPFSSGSDSLELPRAAESDNGTQKIRTDWSSDPPPTSRHLLRNMLGQDDLLL